MNSTAPQLEETAEKKICEDRICRRCEEPKPLSAFGKDCSKPDGKNIYCRLCNRVSNKGQRLSQRRQRIDREAVRQLNLLEQTVINEDPIVEQAREILRKENVISRGELKKRLQVSDDQVGDVLAELWDGNEAKPVRGNTGKWRSLVA